MPCKPQSFYQHWFQGRRKDLSQYDSMNYGNMFHLLLAKVSEDAGWVLQLVNDTRGGRLAELEVELASANVLHAKCHLQELEQLGLVVCVDKVWKTTWTGAGVSNWRTQLLFSENGQPVAEPREGENGQQPGPECSEFRPALFAPGYCWCCRSRKDHVGEVLKAAGRLLRRPPNLKA